MGSKSRIARYILPIILRGRTEGQFYVEPFCGGCNMIDKVDGNRIAADANKYLIAMWQYLTSSDLSFPHYIDKNDYDECRAIYKARTTTELNEVDGLIGWVGFMASFNGKFFNGYSGHDVKGRDYISENMRNVLRQLPALRGVEFIWTPYNTLEIPPQSIIYCDPPYRDTTAYSVKDFDHDDFFEWCRDKVREGHRVFISEYTAPEDFVCVWEKKVTTSLATYQSKKSTEKLFVHESQFATVPSSICEKQLQLF